MPAQGGISGTAVAMAAAGGFLLYVGVQDVGIRDGMKSLVAGKLPQGKPATASSVQKANDTITNGAPGSAAQVGAGAHPEIARAATKYLGVPYAWGGESSKGTDCSGLVVMAFQDAVGVTPPRTTFVQITWKQLTPISRAEFGAGDLAFWPSIGPPSHVAIGMDNSTVIHAPRPGKNVEIVPVNQAFTGGAQPTCMRWIG